MNYLKMLVTDYDVVMALWSAWMVAQGRDGDVFIYQWR
jgi:hypothetical protein